MVSAAMLLIKFSRNIPTSTYYTTSERLAWNNGPMYKRDNDVHPKHIAKRIWNSLMI